MRTATLIFLFACSAETRKVDGDTISTSIFDEDGDGYFSDEDCDDQDAQIHPGATELCDALDNNCDGQVDEGVLSVFFQVPS